ncbi:MAG: nitroreductase family protein [Anaerolineaceae bacterium]|nr:nitroreductase family protein [Anaerolineaceae bacterium]
MESNWLVNQELCKRCGSCVDVCPNRIIQFNDEGHIFFREDRKWECFQCGHCMAICSTKAVQVPELSYENDFYAVDDSQDNAYRAYDNLIRTRRAIRNFKQKPVPRALLEKVVDAIQLAPPGFPPCKTELTIVQDMALIHQAQPMMIVFYEKLVKMLKHPIAKQFIKKSAGREKYITLQNHLLPLMEERLPDLKSGKEDTILRNAPAMILFHANRNTENYRADLYIAVTFGLLAAHALGLGATAMDIIPPSIEKDTTLRALFQIPAENEVVASMILGFPKYKYQRGIKRELPSIQWV